MTDEEHYREMMRIVDKGRRDTWIMFWGFMAFGLVALTVGLIVRVG